MAVKKEGMFDFSPKKNLAIELFDSGVFKGEDISLPVHFDFRNKPGGPVGYDLLYEMAEMLYEEAHKYGIFYNCVAGIAGAGNVVAWALRDQTVYKSAGQSEISFVKISKDGDVIGEYGKNDDTLLVMDTIIDATDCFKAICLLEEKGLKVTAICAVIDQEKGGAEKLKKEGYLFFSVLTTYFFLMSCLKAKKINYATYEKIRDFRRRAL